jgi:colanic acid/amylovoran biosynthesis glycosyltransferase
MKVAYLVSRFPAVSETFVLRELDAVSRLPELEVELLSLFPARDEVVHPAAKRWFGRLERPSFSDGLAAVAYWLGRRPARTISTFALAAAGTARRPRVLWRSMVTVALAATHARRVRREGIEHVHAHFATYPALAAWVCRRLTGVPYSFTAHAHDIFVHQLMLRRKLSDARFAIAISEFNRDFLLGLGAEDASVHVVHCGIDPDLFDFRPDQPGPPPARVSLLCVAALRESKGHAVLLRALAGSGLERVDVVLVGDGPLRLDLEAAATDLIAAGRVRFLGGRTEAEVREMLAAADVFVLPSVVTADGDMEGIPVALMESMASGLLTVASRMSGIPELIRDGETGLLAVPGDAEDLRAALVRATGGESGVDLVAARRLIEAQFDVSVEAERIRDLLLGL